MNAPFKIDDIEQEGKLPVAKLTKEQQDALDLVLTLTLTKQPFFGTLLFQKLEVLATDFPAFPVAATDEFVIWLRRETYFSDRFDPHERMFIMCHEIMHCVFLHCTMIRRFTQEGVVYTAHNEALPFVNEIMQHAADYVINAGLKADGVGKMPVDKKGEPSCLYDEKLSKDGHESVIEVYEKLWKMLPDKKDGPGGKDTSQLPGNKGGGQGGHDVIMMPGNSSGNNPNGRQEAEWKVAVQSAVAAAKAQGNLPGSIERIVGEMMNPKVPWQEHIKATLNRRLGADGYDWRRADRRLITRPGDPIYFAAQSSFSCGTIVIGYDSSGSLWDEQTQATFFGEMSGIINDLNPREVIVMFCDAKVHRVDVLEDIGDLETTRGAGVPGGGGTNFVPVFDEIAERGIEPDALVYFTDMYGTFPNKDPGYPVIWAKTTDVAAPFGDEVKVEL